MRFIPVTAIVAVVVATVPCRAQTLSPRVSFAGTRLADTLPPWPAADAQARSPSWAPCRFPPRLINPMTERRTICLPPAMQATTPPQPNVLLPIAGGLIGAPAGLALGASAGAAFVRGVDTTSTPPVGDWSTAAGAVGGAALGAVLGEPWGVVCGVHIANGRRGDVSAELAAAIPIWAAGLVAAVAANDWRILVAIPFAQTAAVVPIERLTAQAQPREWRACRNPVR